jgi:hypothetical protein
MSAIPSNSANVAYNYQKVPGLVTSNKAQSQAGLTISMRDRPNLNRNVVFLFPTNEATPNYGAGSPTLGARTNTVIDGTVTYAGRQVPL